MPRGEFAFDSGRLCLDLTATLSGRTRERLTGTEALTDWLAGAGFEGVTVERGDVERIRTLRRAVFALVDASLSDRPAPRRAIRGINEAAAAAVPAPQLVGGRDGLRRERRVANVTQAAALIARDAVDLLSGAERSLLRECAAEDCSGIYVDASRGGTRRWCSTRRCGNRARVAAHRARAA